MLVIGKSKRMHTRCSLLPLAIACLGSCASESQPSPACEVRVVAEALTNGGSRADYLKLEPSQENALVWIHVGGVPQCSGVLVADRIVLTAKHCLQNTSEAISVSFGPGATQLEFQTPAWKFAEHPERDVMVLQLEASPSEAIAVAALPVAKSLPAELKNGSLVQLAGFGDDGEHAARRTFLVEQVSEIGSHAIEVSTSGLAGACFGDSGGPRIHSGCSRPARPAALESTRTRGSTRSAIGLPATPTLLLVR
jgi:hypothetical protein